MWQDKMDKDLLLKFIKGVASPKERRYVLDWIEENENNAELYNILKADHVISNLPYTEASGGDLRNIKSSTGQSNRYLAFLVKAAAFLLIPVSLFSVYQYLNFAGKSEDALYSEFTNIDTVLNIPEQNKTTIDYRVNPGVKGLVMLPDGSKVWLNSDSYLKCPGEFDSTFRMVELSGEGYFDIVSNKNWPMYVKTSKEVTVKVTGTEFNISSYNNDNVLRFTLVNGEVELFREGTKQVFPVKESQQIVIPDDIQLDGKRRIADIYANTAWKEGHLIFDNTPMSEVVKKVERWYGVKIDVGNDVILSYNFTADFSSESITQVLDLFKITSNIDYSISGRKVNIKLQKN